MLLKIITPIVNFITGFTLKLDFKMRLLVSGKRSFCQFQVTNTALLGFVVFYHMLSQNDFIDEGFFTTCTL